MTDQHDRQTSWQGLAFGVILATLGAFHLFKLPPVLPVLLETYGYDPRLAGSFMGVYAVIGLVASLKLGRWMQRHGMIRFIQVALVLLATGSLVTLAAPDAGLVVLAGRAIESAGFTVIALAGPAICLASASRRHTSIAMGLMATWMPLGQLISLLLATPALALDGWSLLWWAGLAATGAMLGWSMVLSGRGRTITRSAHGSTRPAAPGDHRVNGALVTGALVFCLYSGQFLAFMTWLPVLLTDVHGLDESMTLLFYAVPIVTVVALNLVGGWILRQGVPVALLLALALGFEVVAWLLIPVTQGLLGLAALVVYGIGSGVGPVCLFALPAAILGRDAGPHAFAVLMTGRNLGVLVGPVLLAQLYASSGAWQTGGFTFALWTGVGLVMALGLHLRLRQGSHGFTG